MAILLGKESDAEVIQHTIDIFIDLKIPYEVVQIQELLDDKKRPAWLEEARHRGIGMIVVGGCLAYMDDLFPSVGIVP